MTNLQTAALISLGLAATVPLLLWLQGRWVRSRVPLLPEAEGERSGVRGSQQEPALSLLIAGDSAAAGVGTASQEQALLGRLLDQLEGRFPVRYRLVAQTGWKTSEVLDHLRALEPFPIDYAVLSIGVNDVTGGRSRSRFARELEELRLLLRETFGCHTILLSALPPVHRFPALPQPLRGLLGLRALAFTRTIERFCRDADGCVFVSAAESYRDLPQEAMASDGFHPGPQIYQLWASTLAERIDGATCANTTGKHSGRNAL